MKALRILVADDHEVVRRGLLGLLKAHPGWEVVGEAVNGREAIEMAKELKPDVLIMDITMPEMNGFEATRLILETEPQTAVLIFTIHKSDQVRRQAMEAGARGYVLKSQASHDLIAAVEALARHETYWWPGSDDPFPKVA